MTAISVAEEQAQMWNGPSGQAWIEQQESLDRMFLAFADLLAAEAATKPARNVLDVGCGTGATTLAIAQRLGSQGRCLGVDISRPMIDVARARAGHTGSRAEFVAADAETHPFEPGVFDLVVSRFGTMFFANPVRAFANLRKACAAGAELRSVAWRSVAENPFMTAAERAVAPLLPNLPARPVDGPGQFAFADARKVRTILESSGWSAIELRPIDVVCTFRAAELDEYVTKLGPVARILPELDEALRNKVIAAVRSGFAPYVHGSEARYTAACWMMCARA